MPLGQLLIDRNLLDPTQLEEARRHQKVAGGTLADSLLAIDAISAEELEAFLEQPPAEAESIVETGLDRQFLLDFVMKAVYMTGLETVPDLADYTKLSGIVVDEVLEDAKEKRLVEVLGLADTKRSIYRYALTDAGRRWALDALGQCQYTGPAPVPLHTWQEQVIRQSIHRDQVTPEGMADALSHLVLPEDMVGRLGPAANSGRAMLLYGGVGNGKTSIAEAVANAFPQQIYIPHCVEVDGQIIKVYDAAVHHACEAPYDMDQRWVCCHRPITITGGELTLEMLDLQFDDVSKTYEAPAHVKATGGVFIIDDFGRQPVRPQDLLNRWIFPLERRVDFMTLHTGKKVKLFFDGLVVFSTNFPPHELMDAAGLRRIPYKFDIPSPTHEAYTEIFHQLCEARGVELPETVVTYMLDSFYPKTKLPISAAHPKALVDAVLERCRFEGLEPTMDPQLVFEAVQNLVVDVKVPPLNAPKRRSRSRKTLADQVAAEAPEGEE
jgi:hypothetical protein